MGDTRVRRQLICIYGKVVSLILMHRTSSSSSWGEFDIWSLFVFGVTCFWYSPYSADALPKIELLPLGWKVTHQ